MPTVCATSHTATLWSALPEAINVSSGLNITAVRNFRNHRRGSYPGSSSIGYVPQIDLVLGVGNGQYVGTRPERHHLRVRPGIGRRQQRRFEGSETSTKAMLLSSCDDTASSSRRVRGNNGHDAIDVLLPVHWEIRGVVGSLMSHRYAPPPPVPAHRQAPVCRYRRCTAEPVLTARFQLGHQHRIVEILGVPRQQRTTPGADAGEKTRTVCGKGTGEDRVAGSRPAGPGERHREPHRSSPPVVRIPAVVAELTVVIAPDPAVPRSVLRYADLILARCCRKYLRQNGFRRCCS